MRNLAELQCYCSLRNQAATCYMNSLLQSLYMTPELRYALYTWRWTEGRDKPKEECIPYQLQLLFCRLQTVDSGDVQTKELTDSFGWTGADAFVQHDVNELLLVLTSALENCFKGTAGDGVIQAMFEGRQKNFVRCTHCGHESKREEVFKNVQIYVKPFGETTAIGSLEEGLHREFSTERLCGDNQYNCDGCASKVDADKGQKLSKAPYILSFSLVRFQYDFMTDRTEKLNDRVEFPRVLDVAPFLDASAADSGGSKRPSVAFGKGGSAVLMRGSSAFEPDVEPRMDYELYAILVHSGGVNAGHYYAYIKSFANGAFYEFNDSRITGPLTDKQIEESFGGTSASVNYYGHQTFTPKETAYMLLYRRIEESVNIAEVGNEHVPQDVLDDINSKHAAEQARREKAAAEAERQKDAVPFAACLRDKCKVVWVKNDKTLHEAKQQVIEELEIQNNPNDVRLLILEPLHHCPPYSSVQGSRPVLIAEEPFTRLGDMMSSLSGKIVQCDIKPAVSSLGKRHQSFQMHVHLQVRLGNVTLLAGRSVQRCTTCFCRWSSPRSLF
eukprot:SAG31_NODE_418_length_15893_cov_5.433899_7_plen_556_part_00